jgi:AP2-associated kinase
MATVFAKVVLVGNFSVRVESLLGEGGLAKVYRVVDGSDNNVYALKHMRFGNPEMAKDMADEARTLAKVHHLQALHN